MRAFIIVAVVIALVSVVGAASNSGDGPGAKPRVAIANAASGLAAGDYHQCALTEGGGVKCWGWNPYGELGDGRACGFFCPYPVDVTGLGSGVTSIVGGGYHTCALLGDGSVRCWGANQSGQLGDSTTQQRLSPIAVQGLDGPAAKLAAGYNHTCALLESGGVQCWGSQQFGQLGNGTLMSSTTAADVAGLSAGVVDVSTGGFSTCAVLQSGAVKCWGYNSTGQLGDGTTQNRFAPVDTAGLVGATTVSVGVSHACALTNAGAVKCWGSNHEGQLGDNSFVDQTTPADVATLGSDITAISAGGFFTCALTNGGAIKCWGDNSWNQLGDAQACGKICPGIVQVSGLTGGNIALVAGLRHACAIDVPGDVTCWGSNDAGQLATGDRDPVANPPPATPVDVDIKATRTITPQPVPTSTPTATLVPGQTPMPTPTPFGSCNVSPNSITNGPRVGMTTDHSAKVWVRSCVPASITLQYKASGEEWSSATIVGPEQTVAGKDNSVTLVLDGLEAAAPYDYRVLVDGQVPQEPLEGSFSTMPTEGEEAAFSFLVGTDMHLSQFPMETILSSVKEHDPLFGIIDGDTVLAEVFQMPGISQLAYNATYSAALGDSAVQQFQANVPNAMVWSDHEIYNDWDHRTAPPYPLARQSFDAYMTAANPPQRDPSGVQFSFKAADVEFYAIDDRTFRSPDEKSDGPNKTMLGAVQKQDLKNWLQTSDARFKFIVSDVWWNDFSGHAAFGESWPSFRTERNEIFDFIQDNRIPGVVLLSGDEHVTGVFKMEPWGIYEIAPGPMSWTPSPPLSPNPQILYTAGHTRIFGIFDVDTTACPATLNVKLYNEANQLRYTLPLTERDLGADRDGNGLVPCEEGQGPTPTPTRTRTPTPQGVRGDASCDVAVNSIDAALILQRTAGLLSNVPCAQNADVNGDGQTNSIDASLVLQYAAGLLEEFP